MNKTRAHLIFLRPAGLLLVKRPEIDWRELQEEYPDYMASLGPWTAAEIVEYFPVDYGDDDTRWPFTRKAIVEFMHSSASLVLEAEG